MEGLGPVPPMVDVKSPQTAANKFIRNAGAAAADYAAGAKAAGEKYASGATAAADVFGQAVRTGDIVAKFRAGIQRAGAAKYTRGVTAKGEARYGPGVQAASGDYTAAVATYFDVIRGVQLPARGPRGAPQNLQRVAAIANALSQRRQAQAGAGR